MLERIKQEIAADPYYAQNFSNDGQRFVAWYLRRVLLRDETFTRQAVTDGPNDKQIDAIVIDDETQRIIIVQGKFLETSAVDKEPLLEVLGAWRRMHDLEALQSDANDRLKARIEDLRQALDDDYSVEFQLLTTGELTAAARSDLAAFSEDIDNETAFTATLQFLNSEALLARLLEAENKDLPKLRHEMALDPSRCMVMDIKGTRSILAAIPLVECLRLPGILDQRLFRRNVRQFLGTSNKVNRGLLNTIRGERPRDFFFFHNGVTALCERFQLSEDRTRLTLDDLSIVNGCQSLATIYSGSESVRKLPPDEAFILFRFYEIPQRDLADRISTFTNSQTAVKPRDLRSNDQVMISLKRAYEAAFTDGQFITQRGTVQDPSKDAQKVVDCAELAKAMMAWQCQRPNNAHNEKKLFDDYYRTLFRSDYNPQSILALQTWLSAIERQWQNLNLRDELKAGKSYVRLHLLYAVSSLIAHASGQGDKVPHPSATLPIARQHAADVLPLAANCVSKALESAAQDAQLAGRVFSPQNWFKGRASVQAETLVASTIVGMLPGIGGQATLDKLKLSPESFGLRWSAD